MDSRPASLPQIEKMTSQIFTNNSQGIVQKALTTLSTAKSSLSSRFQVFLRKNISKEATSDSTTASGSSSPNDSDSATSHNEGSGNEDEDESNPTLWHDPDEYPYAPCKLKYWTYYSKNEAAKIQTLKLTNASAATATFEVDPETATIKLGKQLFSTEASNPRSNMMYAAFINDDGFEERPKPMADGCYGGFIPPGALAIVNEKGEEFGDDVLFEDAGWDLTVCVKDMHEYTKFLLNVLCVVFGWDDFDRRRMMMYHYTILNLPYAVEPYYPHQEILELFSTREDRGNTNLSRLVRGGVLYRDQLSDEEEQVAVKLFGDDFSQINLQDFYAGLQVFCNDIAWSDDIARLFCKGVLYETCRSMNIPVINNDYYASQLLNPVAIAMFFIGLVEQVANRMTRDELGAMLQKLEVFLCWWIVIAVVENIDEYFWLDFTDTMNAHRLKPEWEARNEIFRALESYRKISDHLGKHIHHLRIENVMGFLEETRIWILEGNYCANYEKLYSRQEWTAIADLNFTYLAYEELSYKWLSTVFGSSFPRSLSCEMNRVEDEMMTWQDKHSAYLKERNAALSRIDRAFVRRAEKRDGRFCSHLRVYKIPDWWGVNSVYHLSNEGHASRLVVPNLSTSCPLPPKINWEAKESYYFCEDSNGTIISDNGPQKGVSDSDSDNSKNEYADEENCYDINSNSANEADNEGNQFDKSFEFHFGRGSDFRDEVKFKARELEGHFELE